MFCVECGENLDTGSKFCRFCGVAIIDTEKSAMTQENYQNFNEDDIKSNNIFINKNIIGSEKSIASYDTRKMFAYLVFLMILLLCFILYITNYKNQLTLVSTPVQNEKISIIAQPQKSPATVNAMPVNNLQSLSIEIGVQKIVECTLESVVFEVQLSGNTENTKKLKFVAGLTAKAYSALANAYPNKKELEAFSDSYPKVSLNLTQEERILKIIACSADDRVKPLLKSFNTGKN